MMQCTDCFQRVIVHLSKWNYSVCCDDIGEYWYHKSGKCYRCHTEKPYFEKIIAIGQIDQQRHILAFAIRVLKGSGIFFNHKPYPEIAIPLGLLIARYIIEHQAEFSSSDFMISVPTHKDRIKEGKIDHIAEIAKIASTFIKFPVRYDILLKHKDVQLKNLKLDDRKKVLVLHSR